MRVFAPTAFRWPPQTGKDYPYGWQEIADHSLVLDLKAAGLVAAGEPTPGALGLNPVTGVTAAAGVISDPILIGICGQSCELGGMYASLVYTSSAAAAAGGVAALSTSIANNLPPGELIWGSVAGAVPAGYNTAAPVQMRVTGVWPNCTLSYASAGVGALTTQGTITLDMERTYPAAFASQKRPSNRVPMYPAVQYTGNWWMSLQDKLLPRKVRMINGAIGGMSMAKNAAGQVAFYGANTRYRSARAGQGGGDRGHPGVLIVVGNAVFECTAGGDAVYAVYNGASPLPGVVPSVYRLDYIKEVAGGTSGAVAPNWGSINAVGQTIADGALTWTCRSLNTNTDTDSALRGLTAGMILSSGRYGFDPHGILDRIVAEMGRQGDGYRKLVIVQNGQSDVQGSEASQATIQGWIRDAYTYVGRFFLANGLDVIVSTTLFYPAAQGYQYDSLVSGVNAAHANLVATAPGRAFRGPDLSVAFGRTHGQSGLYLQSDNAHANENVHPQAVMAEPIADVFLPYVVSALGF